MSELPPPNPMFLNVEVLLETSLPKQRATWLWFGTAMFAMVVMVSAAARNLPNGQRIVQVMSALAMLGLIVGLVVLTVIMARGAQREQAQLDGVEELIQLRRWAEAAALLQDLLSRPTRTPQARFQGLVYLAAVLARYHRFGEAIAVYEHLLGMEGMDGETAYGLKLGRAMSLLREDRLFDADRAIAELRRMGGRADSAGLGLIEVYRDVKTGHPQEAIEIGERLLPLMRRHLGVRVADAHGLLARAYDLVNRAEEAGRAWRTATLLVAPGELSRRYPELEATAKKYEATPVPAEAA